MVDMLCFFKSWGFFAGAFYGGGETARFFCGSALSFWHWGGEREIKRYSLIGF
jgi:hypothetical protein